MVKKCKKKKQLVQQKIEEVEKDLNTNLEKGLTTEEVKKKARTIWI